MKNFCLIACLLSLFGVSNSLNIQCRYSNHSWYPYKESYTCEVVNPLDITSKESAVISSVIGDHQNKESNDDVVGFAVRGSNIHYFPRGLENSFTNLKSIKINECGLKEINQADLKPHRNMVHLYLERNVIRTLESGLFDYNPHLETISFNVNEIFNIDQNVFDHLDKLENLFLRDNICTSDVIYDSTEQVKRSIKEITDKCKGEDYHEIDRNLKSLEDILDDTKYKNFLGKLREIEKSRYARRHEKRIDELAVWKDLKMWTINNKIDAIEEEIKDMKIKLDNSLKLLNTNFENLEKRLMEANRNK